MASKINVAYVEKDSVEGHFRAIRSDKIITTDMVDSNGNLEYMVHQSSSRYGDIRSAIDHVYIFARVKMPEIMKREISTFIEGMERIVIVEKNILGLKNSKGKKHQPRGV